MISEPGKIGECKNAPLFFFLAVRLPLGGNDHLPRFASGQNYAGNSNEGTVLRFRAPGLRLEASSERVRPQIAAIAPGSQAAAVGGLRVGMMLVAVQGQAVGPGKGEAMSAIAAAGRPLRLRFE